MTSLPDVSRGRAQRESVLLRGASAASARPFYEGGSAEIGHVAGRQRAVRPALTEAGAPARVSAAPQPRPAPRAETLPAPAAPAAGSTADPATVVDRRAVPSGGGRRAALRLDAVYAEELARLREQARAEGFAAGHAAGLAAGASQAAATVAAAEAAAADRLAVVHGHWERQWATAAAALGRAADTLDATAAPVLDDLGDMLATGLFGLVQELLGRELACAATPGLDAVRRALTLCPADAPVVVRLHPDDLATLGGAERGALPAGVTVLADAGVERGGAVAESGPRRVDAQLGAALERVRAVLLP